MLNFFSCQGGFTTEYGDQLDNLIIGYHTYGKYVKGSTKVIWVAHALTANSNVADWWEGIFGTGRVLDPTRYFIVCANTLGSCYGTSYSNAEIGITIRDMVKAHVELRKHLKIDQIDLLIGGSLGGQQSLEWSIVEPLVINKLVLIATNVKHSSWGIAFNETQRMALELGNGGLAVARAIAMLSYRNYQMYQRIDKQSEEYGPDTYQRYQGEKLSNRFDANSYSILSKAMDSHDIGRNRLSIEHALTSVKAKTLVIGIKTDLLFPINEQKFLANGILNANLIVIDSPYGHDGFLTETALLNEHILTFLNNLNE